MASRPGRRHPALTRGLAALAACASLLVATAAAAASGSADRMRDPWRWSRFGTTSGLPTDGVLDVLETSGGPWVATTAGVAWFDGHAWNAVLSGEPMARRRVVDLVPFGRDGVAGVAGGDIVILTRARHEIVRPTLDGRPVEALRVADAGGGDMLVLLGPNWSRQRLLGRLRPASGNEVTVVPDGPAAVMGLTVGGDGTVLIASGDGLHRWTPSGMTRVLAAEQEMFFVQAAVMDGDDLLLSLASPIARKGTWRVRPGVQHLLDAERICEAAVALARSDDGFAAGAFDSGLVRVREEGEWRVVDSRMDLLRGLTSLALRANGDIWFGSDHGLFLHRRASRRWEAWRHAGHDLRNHVSAVLPRADGSTWIASDGGLEIRRPDGTTETLDAIRGESVRQLTTLAEDARGRVWIGSGAAWSGAWRFDGAEWQRIGAKEGLDAPRLHAIRTLPGGETWLLALPGLPYAVVADGPRAFRLRDDDTFEAWGPEQGLATGRVYDVARLGDDLWFATVNGLWRRRGDAWTRFDKSNGLRMDRAFCLAAGHDGRLWFGAQGAGLGSIDAAGRIEYLDAAHGLVDDEVWGLAVDDAGRLWVATARGLCAVQGDQITSFRGDSGLTVSRLWPVATAGSRVLVGTLGAGVTVLDLGDLETQPPRVVIEDPVVEQAEALLRWKALAWQGDPAPEDLETRLCVDAEPCSAWSASREAMLRGLEPGTRHVRIEARAPLGAGTASAEARFIVEPPPWRQPAFLAMTAALLGLGAVLVAVLWRRRRRARLELEASERRYRELVESASEIVFGLDATGRVAWSNAAGSALLGRERGEMTGRDALETVAPESRDAARDALLQVHRTGKVVTFELTGITKDGDRRLVEVSLGPVLAGGEWAGWHGIARDITERRRRDEERQRAERLESLGLLAGGIAHDFNNVLAGVVGHAGLALEETPDGSPLRPRLEQIERAAMHCAELARQMLDYAGRGRFSMGPVDLGPVVKEAVQLASPGSGGASLSLASPLPLVEGDPAQLQRVIVNLVRNAAEACDGRAGDVEIVARTLASAAEGIPGEWSGRRPPGVVVVVTVRDRGRGMDEATRRRIFEPFFSTRKEGRGLGLAATLGIVRAHGGAIAVESEPGRGSAFHVVLPAIGS